MMDYRATLEQEKYYHIFNHAVGKENLFIEDKNYIFFLDKFEKYISPFIHVYAYCLMPNHFHFLIKVLSCSHAPFEVSDCSLPNAFKSFFTSYTNSYNKVYNRRGSLFEPRFKRLLISSDIHLLNTVLYIHNNPVNHGFVSTVFDWRYSSYCQIITTNNINWLKTEEVISLFGDIKNFKSCHNNSSIELDDIEK